MDFSAALLSYSRYTARGAPRARAERDIHDKTANPADRARGACRVCAQRAHTHRETASHTHDKAQDQGI